MKRETGKQAKWSVGVLICKCLSIACYSISSASIIFYLCLFLSCSGYIFGQTIWICMKNKTYNRLKTKGQINMEKVYQFSYSKCRYPYSDWPLAYNTNLFCEFAKITAWMCQCVYRSSFRTLTENEMVKSLHLQNNMKPKG